MRKQHAKTCACATCIQKRRSDQAEPDTSDLRYSSQSFQEKLRAFLVKK